MFPYSCGGPLPTSHLKRPASLSEESGTEDPREPEQGRGQTGGHTCVLLAWLSGEPQRTCCPRPAHQPTPTAPSDGHPSFPAPWDHLPKSCLRVCSERTGNKYVSHLAQRRAQLTVVAAIVFAGMTNTAMMSSPGLPQPEVSNHRDREWGIGELRHRPPTCRGWLNTRQRGPERESRDSLLDPQVL